MDGAQRQIRSGPVRATTLALVAAVALAVVGPTSPSAALAPRQPLRSAADPEEVRVRMLTREADDTYALSADEDHITVRAPDNNVGDNTRLVLHRPGSPSVVDAESCATWADRRGDLVQLGAALRITGVGGEVQAITVTQNIWVSPYTFNVHTWDTARPGVPWRLEGQFDMQHRFFAFGLVALPLHFCARTVGDRVEFKVWSSDEREPRWDDRFHGDGLTLPEGWVHAGQVGWYAGHLGPGDYAELAVPATWAYRRQQFMTPRPRRR